MVHRFAGVELDTATFELRRNGRAVALGPKPFGVLLYLLRNRARVVPREELLDAVWPDTAVSESSLTQCVYQLRQILPRLPGGAPLIATLYGRGYRLDVECASDGVEAALPREVTAVEPRVHGFGDRPAIAVLPFECGGAGADEILGDGIAEDLIDRLASFRLFPVIAKSSAFRYRGADVDVRAVGRELGVRYAISGSVQRDRGQLRVSATLLDTGSARVVAKHVQRGPIGELFAAQEEVAGILFAALEPDLRRHEIERALRAEPRDLEAWGLFMRGSGHLFRYTREDNARACALFAQARGVDPSFAAPLAFSALTHLNDVNAGWSSDPRRSLGTALGEAEKCVALDPRDPWGHAMLGGMYATLGRRQPAIQALELALARNPSFPVALWGLGRGLSIWGRAREAIELLHRAIRLSPSDPFLAHFLEGLGFAHYFCDEDDEAVSYAEQSLRTRADWPRTHLLHAAALAQLDRLDDARRELALARRLGASYDPERLRASYALADAEPGVVERLMAGLGRAL